MSDLLAVYNGYNADVDQTVEDLWAPGGTKTYAAAAAAGTLESSSANDTAAGTGVRTVQVDGLDANYAAVRETVTLNGTTPVAFANTYLRINSLKILTAGSGLTNAGNIIAKIGSNVENQIETGVGESRSAIYTVPTSIRRAHLLAFGGGIGLATAASTASINLLLRPFGDLWFLKAQILLNSSGVSRFERRFSIPLTMLPKTDIRLTVTTGQDNTPVDGFLDLALSLN